MFKRYCIRDDAANAEKLGRAAGALRLLAAGGGVGGDSTGTADAVAR